MSAFFFVFCKKSAFFCQNSTFTQVNGLRSVTDFLLLLLLSLVTGPSLMSISFLVLELWQFLFIKELTRIPEIGVSVWVLLNTWRLGRVRNTKFGTNVSNKMLLNPAKCQDYSFWVIKGKPTGGEGRCKITPTPRFGLTNVPPR